ncbi:MAG: WD40 repeat domain-containing protein [Methylococcales bacterium]
MTDSIPRFELARVDEDGSCEIEIVPITRLPLETQIDRRGFLGTAITLTAVLALIGCMRKPDSCADMPAFRKGPDPYQLVITPDRQFLASTNGDAVKIWSLSDGRLLKTLEELTYGVAATSDGRVLVTWGLHGVKLWSLPEGQLIRTLQDSVDIAEVAPDGAMLATADGHGPVKLWSFHAV